MKHHNANFQVSPTRYAANVVIRNKNNWGGNSSQKGRNCERCRINPSRRNPSQGDISYGGRSNYSNERSGPVCQVCGKFGHSTLRCNYHFDHFCQLEENHFVALTTPPSDRIDPNQYTNTGATDHITSDLERHIAKEKYNGGK